MKKRSLIAGLLLLPGIVLAQATPPYPSCGNLPGCGTASNVIATGVIPVVATLILRIAAALTVLAVVWAGYSMMIEQGDESRSKQKWAIFYALIGLSIAILSQSLVSFIATEDLGQSNASDFIVGGVIKGVIGLLLNLTNITFAIIIILSGIRMVIAQGKTEEFSKARHTILWTIVGAVVINAAQVIVRIITTYFGV